MSNTKEIKNNEFPNTEFALGQPLSLSEKVEENATNIEKILDFNVNTELVPLNDFTLEIKDGNPLSKQKDVNIQTNERITTIEETPETNVFNDNSLTSSQETKAETLISNNNTNVINPALADKVDISTFIGSQSAQDTFISDNKTNISTNTDNILIESNKLNDVIENSFQKLNKIDKKSSNPSIIVQDGDVLGFNVTNGNNWNISNGLLEWVYAERIDSRNQPMYGLKLQAGKTIDGLFGLNGRLSFLFGSLSNSDGGVMIFRQYGNETDFQAGTNQVGLDLQLGSLPLTDRLDNTQIDIPISRTDLQAVLGEIWLLPLILVTGNYPVQLLGKNQGYESFIEMLTGGVGTVTGSFSGDIIDDSLTRPNKNLNIKLNKIADKLDKELIGTTRTTKIQYNSFGELETFSYDNITGIGFKSKVKPDGIIVSNWDNNTGIATDYTQSEPGSLTSKAYVDNKIGENTIVIDELSIRYVTD